MSSKEYIGTAYPMKNIDKNDIIPIENIIAHKSNSPFKLVNPNSKILKPLSRKVSKMPSPESGYRTPEPKKEKIKVNSPGKKISFKSLNPMPFRKNHSDSTLETSLLKSFDNASSINTPKESVTSFSSSSVNNIDNTPDTDVGLYLSDDDIDDEGYKSVWRIVPTPPKRNGGYKTKKRKYIKKPKTLKKRIKKILKKSKLNRF